MLGTVAEAGELAEKLVNWIGECNTQVVDDAAPVSLPLLKTEVVLLSANLRKTREE